MLKREIIKNMNRIIFYCLIVVLGLIGCKTAKQTKSAASTDPVTPPKVFSVPETIEPAAKPKTTENPVAVRKEQVSFTQQVDKTQNEANTYFVIIGSFSQLENAKTQRETLLKEGFTPIIVHSETGYYRICTNSYKSETEARNRIAQIRTMNPKYADVWLLVKE